MKTRPMIPTLIAAALLCAGVALFSLQMLARSSAPEPVVIGPGGGAEAIDAPLRQDPNMDLLSIPSFTLTTQDGQTITRDDLEGRLTVVDFIFTSCPFICPTLNTNMKTAQQALEGTDVRFLSISVDPERDTPERLREHAEEIDADLSTWTFATGPRKEVQRILTQGLMLAELQEDPSRTITLDDGSTMNNITHPGRFVLIGPDAEILALYNGLSPEQTEMLIARARAASKELDGQSN